MKINDHMLIGVLALQGDFAEHLASLKTHGLRGMEVRTPHDLEKVDALILPGGESTTMAKLLKSASLDKKIIQRSKNGMPIWGTCAGAILLAKNAISQVPLETKLGLLDMTIERNGYGRQTESFEAPVKIGSETHSFFFIRAPRIIRVGRGVKVIAKHRYDPVLIRAKNILASTFHSEFSERNVGLDYFLNHVIQRSS